MKIGTNSLLLVGCGKMGSALLRGWLSAGLAPDQVTVLDPNPSDWLRELEAIGLHLNIDVDPAPSVAVIAVKPQVLAKAIPGLRDFGGGGTLFVSIAAGASMSAFENLLGPNTPVVRTMPNTPAAVGAGMTALVPNLHASPDQVSLADMLMRAVGETVLLDDEPQMHAVTAISGSGPAYVFALTEALARAGTELGLRDDIAQKLSSAMVCGSGKLMDSSTETPGERMVQVTSPNGTTAAGLEKLQAKDAGIDQLILETAQAAFNRSVELSQEAR